MILQLQAVIHATIVQSLPVSTVLIYVDSRGCWVGPGVALTDGPARF